MSVGFLFAREIFDNNGELICLEPHDVLAGLVATRPISV